MKLQALFGAQALRSQVSLEPIDGPGGRIFPPTYPGPKGTNDEPPRHVVEKLPDGRLRVLVDGVASQANRQEAALVAARASGQINFSDVHLDLSGTEAEMKSLSATEMPHRLSDAMLRDSEIGGVEFHKSETGKSVLSAPYGNLTPLIETSPTSLVFGCWFSQHGLARQFRIQRSTVSEIWADNAVLGQAVGSRIDPLGIEKLDLYETDAGDWTALAANATLVKGKPKIHSKKKPSAVNHGNIAPSIREQGITAQSITLRWAMPLAAIRRLRFGETLRDQAGQAYIAALGLLARVLDHEAGYSLRSRCDLISKGPIVVDVIAIDGSIESVSVGREAALALLAEAEAGMTKAGLKIHQRTDAKPSGKLKDLIAANKRLQEAGEGTNEEVAA